MKKILLVFVMLLICLRVVAQEMPKIMPPSPEAASLGKFIDMPVSHYTGLPSIDIPIYTIQEGGVSIPISLSYHAKGIQVGEIPSRVGLGWSLNYGGSLSRQVRGSEDDGPRGYFEHAVLIDSSFSHVPSRTALSVGANFASNAGENYDLVPDKFLFNANGTSGDFIFDFRDLNAPLMTHYKDVVVTPFFVDGKIEKFTITDANGTVYSYGKSSTGQMSYSKDVINASYTYNFQNGLNQFPGSSYSALPNSWQLMEVLPFKGGEVSYIYENETFTSYSVSYDKVELVSGNESTSMTNQATSHFSKKTTTQPQLKEIRFSNGSLKFNRSTTPRLDVIGNDAFPLASIEVFDKAGNFIKKINFEYEYKTAINTGNENIYLSGLYDQSANKRLFLKSTQQVTETGASLPKTIYTYSNEELPSRYSTSQDVWGYYNGADNGGFLTFFNYGNTTINRTVDTLKAEAGMLKKITHPTGGSTEFYYEHNKVASNPIMDEIVYNAMNPIVDRKVTLSNFDYPTYYNTTTNVYEKEVTIENVFNKTIAIAIDFQDTTGCVTTEPECKFEVSLSGNGETRIFYLGTTSLSTLGMPDGMYTLKVKPLYNGHDPADMMSGLHGFTVRMDWIEGISGDVIYAAGKRIQRIAHMDANGAVKSFKAYDYSAPNGLTSGKLFGLPNFFTIRKQILGLTNTVLLSPTGGKPGVPLSAPQGNSAGYEYVTEYYGDRNTNLGKTQYQFTMPYDHGEYYKFPYHLPISKEWQRGKALETKFFKNDAGTYRLVKENKNTYDLAGLGTYNVNDFMFPLPGAINALNEVDPLGSLPYANEAAYHRLPFIKIFYEEDPSTGLPNPFGNLMYKTYYLSGGTQDLKSSSEKTYLESGRIRETTTTYSYDYDNHYQVKSTQVTDSKGDENRTVNYYPTDLSADALSDISTPQSTYINRLQADNRMEVIQQSSFKNDLLQATTRTSYLDTYGMVLPKAVQTSKGTNPLEDRIVYHSYDTKGNPVEVSKADGTRIRYVWGYHQTQPIAKIEGYTCETITDPVKGDRVLCLLTDAQSQAITNAVAASLNETTAATEDNLRAKLQLLKDSFANTNVQVTTFTYDPLVGITSMTDPRGYTVYYHYDAFNRLEHVKDAEGNILNKNEYNYKN